MTDWSLKARLTAGIVLSRTESRLQLWHLRPHERKVSFRPLWCASFLGSKICSQSQVVEPNPTCDRLWKANRGRWSLCVFLLILCYPFRESIRFTAGVRVGASDSFLLLFFFFFVLFCCWCVYAFFFCSHTVQWCVWVSNRDFSAEMSASHREVV